MFLKIWLTAMTAQKKTIFKVTAKYDIKVGVSMRSPKDVLPCSAICLHLTMHFYASF